MKSNLFLGNPNPDVTWLKDGHPLKITPRHFEINNRQLLVIVQAHLNDAGTYTCEVSNALGVTRRSSLLHVSEGKN